MNLSKAILLAQICTIASAATSLRGKINERELDSRVIGGTEAVDGRYSYAVSLQDSVGGRHFCGGSLIAPNVVLSAAHCMQTDVGVKVVIGRHDLRNTTDGDEVNVQTQIPHPDYDQTTTNNDYMILILERDTTEDVNFINIHPGYVSGDISVTTMGYGDTDPDDIVSYPAPILMHTEVKTVSNDECKQSSGHVGGDQVFGWNIGGFDASYSKMITDNMICASDNGEDSCFGDSGGPLVILSDTGDDLQVGVVSWGYGCAHADFPGVYARVSAQYDWIKEQVCDGSSSPPESFECDNTATAGTLFAEITTQELSTDEEPGVGWTTIYNEDFKNPYGLFYQVDGSNNVTPYAGAAGRDGVVHIHGGEGGLSVMKSNLSSMDGNPFTHCKVTFSFYASEMESDDLCFQYEINDGAITGEQCWYSQYFENDIWYDDMNFEFELEDVQNLRLIFQVKGDDAEDEVLIDSVTIQGKTSTSR